MKYIPAYTVILTTFALLLAIMFRPVVKDTVYQVKQNVPSYIKNNLELTADSQFIEVEKNGNITIR